MSFSRHHIAAADPKPLNRGDLHAGPQIWIWVLAVFEAETLTQLLGSDHEHIQNTEV